MWLKKILLVSIVFVSFLPSQVIAQVNSVVFGKNKIQYKKMKWKFYEGKNFDTYVNQGGLDLGNYVSQMAETELPEIEAFMESSLRGKANIFVYNSYDEFKQSNIGLGSQTQNTNGVTILPNNKMVVYFDGNHQHLKMQIRHGIAQMILNNLLFGEDIGEVASNQALLDLPKWLTDGYISYAAEHWSTKNDDDLKNEMLNGDYKTFYHFAFKKPALAGHSFWNFIAEKYKPENVTYFLYLARIYRNLNAASAKICKKRMKPLLAEFMEYEQDKYDKDIRRRRNAPKGSIIADEDVSDKEYYRFQANPNPKNKNYVVVEFKKGFYSVKYFEDYEPITLMKRGIRTHEGDINPNYPILAWDVKGTKILCIYWEAGKTKMFVYDVIAKYKRNKQEIKDFDQILDANYMLDDNTLVLSAAKNGHTDIYTYKIEEQKATQITNDVYDDLNPSLVSFANRTGIIYSSNRPSPNASLADTVQPSRYRFNVFLVDILNNSATKQITQLTNLKYGNATMPMQYNTNHFTFVSDENGVGNRWAGFFNTQRAGLDTLYFVGDEMLRNPSAKEMDSALVAWRKQEPDSIAYFQVYKDTTYTFPITNYQSSLTESRVAGNNGQISETRREGNDRYLYKLKVNEDALYKRNVTAPPTDYMKRVINAQKAQQGKATTYIKGVPQDSSRKVVDFFQSEFANEKPDTTIKKEDAITLEVLKPKARLFNSKIKFQADNLQSGIANNLLVSRYQPYGGGFGPIKMSNGNNINFAFQAGVYDLMEDYKINGGVRLGSNLKDKDIFINYQNYKRRLDWGLSYYRSNLTNAYQYRVIPGDGVFRANLITNIYQANISYPFDEARSLRITGGIRSDRITLKPSNLVLGGAPDPIGLFVRDSVAYNVMGRFEYVHDNTITPAMNIWEGLRWKAYMDFIFPGADKKFVPFQETFNFGVDVRNYIPIYRNCTWALRVAADFSWGSKKIIYYLGGVDGDLLLNDSKFNSNNTPAPDQTYAFQSLAVNMRGYNQNVANGNNAFVINSEIRLPIFSTFFNQPVNNAFLRNLQLVQFLDLGTAWNGKYNGIKRPSEIYTATNNPITVKIDAGGLGPFAGGYGFGVRSTLLGYFLKFDVAWPMKGVFVGKPLGYFALGLDF